LGGRLREGIRKRVRGEREPPPQLSQTTLSTGYMPCGLKLVNQTKLLTEQVRDGWTVVTSYTLDSVYWNLGYLTLNDVSTA